jgi:hypothetical protein
MYKPIKLKNLKSGQILGGGEDMPAPYEQISKKEPNKSIDKFPDIFRPASGSKIELVANSTDELKKFIVENTYENLFGELGNRVALTDFTAEEFKLSGHWVISATMWPLTVEYVNVANIQYPSSRVTTGFQADTTEVNPNKPTAATNGASGQYIYVGRMGNEGISYGAHFHLDEFPDDKWVFKRQIAPTSAPGRPSDIPIRVGLSPEFDFERSWIFGTQPGFKVTSGYGQRNDKPHRGVDCVSPAQYIFCPAGTFKTQTGVSGYGNYIWCGRFGIGHAVLAPNVLQNKVGLQSRLGFGEAGLGLASLPSIPNPLDSIDLEGRFS